MSASHKLPPLHRQTFQFPHPPTSERREHLSSTSTFALRIQDSQPNHQHKKHQIALSPTIEKEIPPVENTELNLEVFEVDFQELEPLVKHGEALLARLSPLALGLSMNNSASQTQVPSSVYEV